MLAMTAVIVGYTFKICF